MSRKRSMIEDSILPGVKRSRQLRSRAKYAANVLGELGISVSGLSEQLQRIRSSEQEEIQDYIGRVEPGIVLLNIQELARLAR